MSWITSTYDGYDEAVARVEYAMDAYSGSARDKAMRAAQAMQSATTSGKPGPDERVPITSGGDSLGIYLYKRAQGEHALQFRERANLTRYPMHMQAIVVDFVGRISEIDANARRAWGVLGDPRDPRTVMSALASNCDGAGTNWSTRMSESTISLIVVHDLWYTVMPPSENGRLPKFRLLDVPQVTNYVQDDGLFTEIIVKDMVRSTSTLQQEDRPGSEEHRVYYTLDGWQRYRIRGKEETLVGEGVWSQDVVSRDGRKRLPFGRVRLPLRYPVGYRVAQGNIDLYNLFSDIRNLIRVANHPVKRAVGMTDTEFWSSVDAMEKGYSSLLGDWSFIGPDPGNAETGYEIYRQEVRDFYITSLQQYNDAPVTVTARQVDEDAKPKVAFLSVLSDALDEIENDALFLTSQIVAPASPSAWADARVERSKDFKPSDDSDQADRLAGLYFGKDVPVPSGRTGKLNAAMKIHQLSGIEVDEAELGVELDPGQMIDDALTRE